MTNMLRSPDKRDDVDPPNESRDVLDEQAASLLILLALFHDPEEAT